MILSDLRYPFRIKRTNRKLNPRVLFAIKVGVRLLMGARRQTRSPSQGRPPSD